MIEAQCFKCGEIFNPHDEDEVFAEGDSIWGDRIFEHYQTAKTAWVWVG